MRAGLGLLCAAQEALSLDVITELAEWGPDVYEEQERFLREARQLLLEEPASWSGTVAYRPRHDWVHELMAGRLGVATTSLTEEPAAPNVCAIAAVETSWGRRGRERAPAALRSKRSRGRFRATMTGLEGVSVVITGAGRGLGAALALALADLGGRLTLCGRSPSALDAVARQVEARCGRRSAIVELDLADALGVERAAADIRRATPIVDILINNGAMWLARKDSPYTAAEVSGAIGSALTGTFLLTQALLPALLDSNRPDVVTIGSISGLPGAELRDVSVPFFAAKHGQVALAEGLRQLFWGTPVRSICVQPPWLEDLSPLDPAWNEVPSRAKGARATNRDVVETVIFALTRPRHITLASVTIDSDTGGLDSRGHG